MLVPDGFDENNVLKICQKFAGQRKDYHITPGHSSTDPTESALVARFPQFTH